MSEGKKAMVRSQERPASTFNGYLMLLLWLALLALAIWRIHGVRRADRTPTARRPRCGSSGCIVAAVPVRADPVRLLHDPAEQSAVITLFGEYSGTERTQGLRWIWPWMGKQEDLGPRSTTSIPSGSRSTTCAATRSRSPATWCGAWPTPRRRRSTSTTTRRSSTSRSRPGCAPSARAIPTTTSSTARPRCAVRPRRSSTRELRDRAQRAAVARRHRGRRGGPDPPRLCLRDRRGDAAPPAGRGGDRRARQAGDGRGLDGRDGARQAQPRAARSTSTTSAARRWSRT